MLPTTYQLTLQASRMLTPSVMHLSFVRADAQAFTFIPGQFITLHFTEADKIVRRSYSVATIVPTATTLVDTIEIAVSYVPAGLASERLFHLQVGQQVEAIGPFGRLVLDEKPASRYLLVATGTGITPYRSMLPTLLARLARDPALEIIILLGVRNRIDLLYVDDFLAATAQNARLQFYACYSREYLAEEVGFEKRGYVNQFIKNLTLTPAADLVYLCGNPLMIDEVFAYLKEHDFATENIRREKYISPVTRK